MRQDAAVLLAEEEAQQKRRSQVLQRSLPRPSSVNPLLGQGNGFALLVSPEEEDRIVSGAIGSELVQLVGHDNYVYPVSAKSSGKKSKRATAVELEELEDEYLAAARELVSGETASVLQSARESSAGIVTAEEYGAVWEEQVKQLVYVASPHGSGGCYRPASSVSKAELLSSLEIQYQTLKARMDKDGKKCAKLEQKIAVKCQGYMTIAERAEAQLRHSLQEFDNRTIELGACCVLFVLCSVLCAVCVFCVLGLILSLSLSLSCVGSLSPHPARQ